MKVKYTIHNQAGKKEDKTVTVSGKLADTVLGYKDDQKNIGITIICDNCGKDYFENEIILMNGNLGCRCQDD